MSSIEWSVIFGSNVEYGGCCWRFSPSSLSPLFQYYLWNQTIAFSVPGSLLWHISCRLSPWQNMETATFSADLSWSKDCLSKWNHKVQLDKISTGIWQEVELWARCMNIKSSLGRCLAGSLSPLSLCCWAARCTGSVSAWSVLIVKKEEVWWHEMFC